ncbi:unnamed protein product [Adineta steineri]|uniref:Arrestin-like N-terminal domain-containing protein n=1 Tax=Adineta steineri TaxID=433720 RepID=A0A819E4H9_9BILA|nr:unnamed protein product [Adineta steineri]CAF3844018.1 unnamed protein product [Adineta steineri]
MGSGISCSIELTPTKKDFYWTGETISGNVSLKVDRMIKVKSMDISIIGQRNYTIINSSGGGPNNIGGTHIERIKKVFYIKRYPLLVQSTLGVFYPQSNTYQFRSCMVLA